MKFINIGALHIPLDWILVGISLLIVTFILRLYIHKAGTAHKQFIDNFWNGCFLFLLVWKLSIIVFQVNLVIDSPLSILYFSGGEKGIWLGVIISFSYLVLKLKKQGISFYYSIFYILLMGYMTVGFFCLLKAFYVDHLITYLLVGIVFLTFASIIMYLGNTKLRLSYVKNIIGLSLLASLICYGVYDFITENANTQLTKEKSEIVSTNMVGLKKGNQAPDFELKTIDGKPVKLSDYKGKRVLLNFWATWCPPCKAEMPHMQVFYEEQKERQSDIEILSVNLTDAEKDVDVVSQFVKNHELTFPILLDKKDIGDKYLAFTIPTSYIIDSKGVIQYKMVGPMSKEMMEKLFKTVN